MKGIYKIENEKTGKAYIGQSVDLQHRFVCHNTDLIKNKHDNKFLQEDWNNKDKFTFEILEETINLNEREGYWMNQYDNLYNISGNRELKETKCSLEIGVKYEFNTELKYNYDFPFQKLINQLRKGTISNEDKIGLFNKFPFLQEAIEVLGFERIATLKLNRARIKKETTLEKKKIKYRKRILERMEVKVGEF